MIKAVASAIPSYPLSFFCMPKSWCLEIDRALKNFWWGHDPEKKRNLHLKSWTAICAPRARGGLGMRLMQDVNILLVSKLTWKVMVKEDNL